MVASGTNARIAYIGETTHGTTPGSPQFVIQRGISRNINLKKATLESQESSAGRQRSDVRHGFRTIEGEIGVELSLETYNDWLLWAVGTSAWFSPSAVTHPAHTLQITSVTNASTITRTTGNYVVDQYRPGDWIVLSGFPTGANNARWRVLAVTTTILTVNATLTTEAGDADSRVDFVGKKCVVSSVGQSLKTFSLEREILDLDAAGIDLYQIYRGVAINQLSLSARPEALVSATFRLLGMTGTIDGNATSDTGGGYTAAPTNSPFASIDGTVYTGAFTLNTATQFDFTLDNQRTLFPVIGATTSGDVYEGTAKCSGSLGLLLQNNLRVTAFQNESEETQGFQIRFNELGTNDFITFNFYRVKFTACDIDPPQNGPVVQQINWEALAATFATGIETMHIQRSTLT